MSGRFVHLKHPLLTPKTSVLYSSIILAVLGGVLLYGHTRHKDKYVWRPVEIPLQIEAGEVARGSFVAELDEPHEIEIEVQRRIPAEDLNRLIRLDPSPLDIKWSIFNKDQVVAEGTCRDYLYISAHSGTVAHRFARKVKRTILNRPYEQGGAIVRGVGRFACKAGAQYDLHVEVGTTIEALNATNPIFRIRINRLFEVRHKPKTKPIAIGGIVALGLSLLAFGWWGLTALLTD